MKIHSFHTGRDLLSKGKTVEYFTWQDEENPSSPLFLPCCDWLSGVGSGGSGSCGCSELGWSGCWCLPSIELLHLMLCAWALLSAARAACRLFLEIFLCSHHRLTLSAVLQALAKERSSASLWKGGCAKGWERKEGHVEREYETLDSIIASVYYSHSASEMALISS